MPGVGDVIKLRVPGVDGDVSPSDVGVGVSQTLPVIAAVLLANPGDLIVLEQPELHLHPDAQLRLAKFFIAAIQTGRKLVIESHSEHFLNQLRLSVAVAGQEAASKLTQDVGFVFAERGQDGESQFKSVSLTAEGSVVNWPKGFFDQGSRIARQLLSLRNKANS